MTEVLFWFYLAGVANSLNAVATIMVIASSMTFLFTSIVVQGIEQIKPKLPVVKHSLIVFCVSLFFLLFTPSSTLLYVVSGLKAGEEVAKTEIAQKAYNLLNHKLDKLLKKVGEKDD